MVPALGAVPSPQVIFALNWLAVPFGSPSVKVATVTFVAVMPCATVTFTPVADRGASTNVETCPLLPPKLLSPL